MDSTNIRTGVTTILLGILALMLPHKLHGVDNVCEPVYRLTECRNGTDRWRVVVPRSSACRNFLETDGSVVQKLPSCDVSCPSGQYFNLSTIRCEKCQRGTFAAGSTLRLSDWSFMPEGMITENKLTRVGAGGGAVPSADTPLQQPAVDQQCVDEVGWQVLGDSVGIVVPSKKCVNLLTLPVTLVKDGYVAFTYRYSHVAEVLFQFDILHGCRSRLTSSNSTNDDTKKQKNNNFPLFFDANAILPFVAPSGGVDDWRTIRVNLSAGESTLKWSALATNLGDAFVALSLKEIDDIDDDNSASKQQRQQEKPPIQIREIVVDGLTSETLTCTQCAPGTFAAQDGSSKCESCDQNTFAEKFGSSFCKPCNSLTEFSPTGSSKCTRKPPCTENDIFISVLRDDRNGNSTVEKSVRAQCGSSSDASSSIFLYQRYANDTLCNAKISSPSGQQQKTGRKCSELCSAGSQISFNNRNVSCKFCPYGTYRNIQQQRCQACPPGTIPRSGLWFHAPFVNDLLDTDMYTKVLNSTCFSTSPGGCFSSAGFRANGDALVSQRGVDGAFMTMQLRVDGFAKNLPSPPSVQTDNVDEQEELATGPPPPTIGSLDFEFEMHCKSKQCFLQFVLTDIRHLDHYEKKITSGNDDDENSNSDAVSNVFVKSWSAHTSAGRRIRYSLPIYRNVSFYAVWLFSKLSLQDDFTGGKKLSASLDSRLKQTQYINDAVRIYSINVTNALGGGADSCVAPAVRDDDDDATKAQLEEARCNSARGEYWNSTTKRCERCDNFSQLSTAPSIAGRKICKPCGHNLISDETRSRCYSPCQVPLFHNNNISMQLNFSATNLSQFESFIDLRYFLNQVFNVKSADFNFQGEHSTFEYNFQFQLCGEKLHVECRENMSMLWNNPALLDSLLHKLQQPQRVVRSSVCRTSLVTPITDFWAQSAVRFPAVTTSQQNADNNSTLPARRLMSTSPTALADELLGICTSLDLLSNSTSTIQPKFFSPADENFWDKSILRDFDRTNAPDIHFIYALNEPRAFSSELSMGGGKGAAAKASACSSGKHVIVTLRCVRDARRNGTILLSPSCPSGTCDGCTYRFLMLTELACPPCRVPNVEYREVVEQCGVGGFQRVTRQPLAAYCLVPPDTVEWRACSIVPLWMQIILVTLFLMMSALVLVVLAQWNRTRSLQYKYSKLVAQSEYEADQQLHDDQRGGGIGGGGSGRLPQVESCAIEEEEVEEDEEEHFSKPARGSTTTKTSSRMQEINLQGDTERHRRRHAPQNDDDENFEPPTAQRIRPTIFGRVRNALRQPQQQQHRSEPLHGRGSTNDEVAMRNQRSKERVNSPEPSRSGAKGSSSRASWRGGGTTTGSGGNRRLLFDQAEKIEKHRNAAQSDDTAYLVAAGSGSEDDDRHNSTLI